MSFGVTAARALEEGVLDGVPANGMGAEVAVPRGVGTVVLDVRLVATAHRSARAYTFPALVTTEERIQREPGTVDAAVRALVKAQHALSEDPSLATPVGRKRFPPAEAELIAKMISAATRRTTIQASLQGQWMRLTGLADGRICCRRSLWPTTRSLPSAV